MTKNEYKSRLMLIGFNQSLLAKMLNVSNNTISENLNKTKIPMLYQLALIGLEQQHKQGEI